VIQIVDGYASMAALQRMAANKSRKDELLYQSTQMVRDLLDYANFDAAIKMGDVGYLQVFCHICSFGSLAGRTRTMQSRFLSYCKVYIVNGFLT
jgi:hypothetical protein